MRSIVNILVCLLSFLALQAAAQPPVLQNTSQGVEAAFVGFQDGRTVVVQIDGENGTRALATGTLGVRKILKNAARGDRLELIVDDAARPAAIQSVLSLQTSRDFLSVLAYMGAALLMMLAFGAIVTRRHLLALVTGADNRYSNSKFQMAAWFFVLFGSYLATILIFLRNGWVDYLGQISIPQNLVILSGLSALTYGAAKAITVTKIEDAKAQSPHYLAAVGAPPPAPDAAPNARLAADKVVALKVTGARRPSLRDLVQDDEGCVDLADCQALFITLLALTLYVVSAYVFLSRVAPTPGLMLPDVDTALLSIFGLGQGAYLAKKVASRAGEG